MAKRSGALEVPDDTPNSKHRFGDVTDEKSSGSTYTPPLLADFVARQIVNSAGPILEKQCIRVLDPAVGDGELLLSIVRELRARTQARIEVHGFDTDENALRLSEERLAETMPENSLLELENVDFLDAVLAGPEQHGPAATGRQFDLLIANPPYVRTQIMGADNAQRIARQFKLSGRVDLYYAFLIGIGSFLEHDGVAGIIVSNRFMTIKSGETVRSHIRKNLHIEHVWDLGDTKLFDVAVLPAVLLLRKSDQRAPETAFTSIYESELPAEQQADSPIEGLHSDGVVGLPDGRRFKVQQGRLHRTDNDGEVWRISTTESEEWLSTVARGTWKRFGEIGKIRVGVKTTADKVFIRTHWGNAVEGELPELLQPLTTHRIARRYRATEDVPATQILYTHEVVDGKRQAIELSDHPRAEAYLRAHRETLEGRKYVIDAGRHWYEIWVPQDPSAFAEPKLVFRDISQEPIFWFDRTGSIVNGDCYWMVAENGYGEDLLWLTLGIANSKFAEEFYDSNFRNQLYAGRRRFITQYVEQFPLPDPALDVSAQIVALTREIYDAVDTHNTENTEARLNGLVHQAFGLM